MGNALSVSPMAIAVQRLNRHLAQQMETFQLQFPTHITQFFDEAFDAPE